MFFPIKKNDSKVEYYTCAGYFCRKFFLLLMPDYPQVRWHLSLIDQGQYLAMKDGG